MVVWDSLGHQLANSLLNYSRSQYHSISHKFQELIVPTYNQSSYHIRNHLQTSYHHLSHPNNAPTRWPRILPSRHHAGVASLGISGAAQHQARQPGAGQRLAVLVPAVLDTSWGHNGDLECKQTGEDPDSSAKTGDCYENAL
jgi:hypothetical protein